MKKRNLTKGNVTAVMLLFAVPMILGNIMQQCYNLADTWIVGRFVGAEALAAVGSAYTLMTFLNSILIGMCMGSGALFSICYGRRALRKLKEYIVSSFVLIFSVTVILTIVSYVCLDPILTLMQIPADIYGLMRSYMGLILAGLIFVFLYNYFAHTFTEIYGIAPMNYLAQKRIFTSQELLTSTDLNQAAIAKQCGFSSSSYFSQCFRKICGMTPTAYRKQFIR